MQLLADGSIPVFVVTSRVRSLMFVIAIIVSIVPIIWIFVDLFLIPGIARRYNNDLTDRLQR